MMSQKANRNHILQTSTRNRTCIFFTMLAVPLSQGQRNPPALPACLWRSSQAADVRNVSSPKRQTRPRENASRETEHMRKALYGHLSDGFFFPYAHTLRTVPPGARRNPKMARPWTRMTSAPRPPKTFGPLNT